MHYPDFITKWGPLVRLFTLRFESKHVFFKNVAKACKNYINITYTLARKYACKFALDHSDGLLPPDISFDIQDSTKACHVQWSEEQKSIIDLIPNLENILVTENIEIYGVHYRTGELLQLGLLNICDLEVGIIEKILVQDSISVLFLLELKTATNSYNGYYQIDSSPSRKWKVITYEDLIDHYPIPVYKTSVPKNVLFSSILPHLFYNNSTLLKHVSNSVFLHCIPPSCEFQSKLLAMEASNGLITTHLSPTQHVAAEDLFVVAAIH
ncbi:Nitrile-specifier protein 4 [Frankliniella fusca]|uniref:Nitrile-specifier protein 4 n=1 Tax=Frankliniella fusca TaxID=407009 RepID=A0AAE1LBR3_9NEOP|nr:Nitrile-specifier protein 4 [Frankliniella fusca]